MNLERESCFRNCCDVEKAGVVVEEQKIIFDQTIRCCERARTNNTELGLIGNLLALTITSGFRSYRKLSPADPLFASSATRTRPEMVPLITNSVFD